PRARAAGRGVQRRRRGAGDLDRRPRRADGRDRARGARLRGPGRAPRERRPRVPRRQPEPPPPGHREGAARARLRARGAARRGPQAVAPLVRAMRVVVVGAGHVGLVTAACLAEKGHEVVCADVDAERVRAVEAGRTYVYEPGLDELVGRNAGDRLRATTDVRAAVSASELSLIAVP